MIEAGAVVAIWNGIEDGALPAFYDWHESEHMSERLGIDGFLRGRRYRAVLGAPEFFTRYDVIDKTVLTSRAYLARLNAPTPRTLAMMPHFRDVSRALCRTLLSSGPASGGYLCTIRISEGAEDIEAVLRGLMPAIGGNGVLSVQLLKTDNGASAAPTREQRERHGSTDFPDWLILAEARNGAAAEKICSDIGAALARLKLKADSGVYLLECDLQ